MVLAAVLVGVVVAAIAAGLIILQRAVARVPYHVARNAARAAVSGEIAQHRRDIRRISTQVATHDEGMVALRRQMEEGRQAVADLRSLVLDDVVEGMLGATLPRGPVAEWEGPPSGVARRVVAVTRDDEGEEQ